MTTTKIFIIAAIVIVAGAGWYMLSGDTAGSDVSMQKGEATTSEETGVMMEEKDESTMMSAGSYEAYAPEKLALAADGDVLLFFHAPWCPICRAVESEINANLSALPAGVHILKVDYDSAIALRQKYGVTVQHTFVQVDSEGALVQKFMDATSLAGVLARVK